MKIYYRSLLCIILGLAVLYLGACKATVRGIKGEESYQLNRSITKPNYWETVINKDVRPVYSAALAGVKDMGLDIITSKVDSLSGVIEGFYADKTEYRIIISYQTPENTLIQINTGLTGSKSRTLQLFHAIEKRF